MSTAAVPALEEQQHQEVRDRLQWAQAAKLSKLDLAHLGLYDVPSEVQHLLQVVKVDLSHNRLRTITPLLRLSAIVKLDLSHNMLHELPEGLSEFTSLRILNLSRNFFSKFPMVVCSLTSLRELYIAHNKIATIPLALGALTDLEALNVSHNQLQFVPGDLFLGLRHLQVLDLSSNQLTKLPLSVGQLLSLRVLFLAGNELTFPPPDICEQGAAAVVEFLRERYYVKTEGLLASSSVPPSPFVYTPVAAVATAATAAPASPLPATPQPFGAGVPSAGAARAAEAAATAPLPPFSVALLPPSPAPGLSRAAAARAASESLVAAPAAQGSVLRPALVAPSPVGAAYPERVSPWRAPPSPADDSDDDGPTMVIRGGKFVAVPRTSPSAAHRYASPGSALGRRPGASPGGAYRPEPMGTTPASGPRRGVPPSPADIDRMRREVAALQAESALRQQYEAELERLRQRAAALQADLDKYRERLRAMTVDAQAVAQLRHELARAQAERGGTPGGAPGSSRADELRLQLTQVETELAAARASNADLRLRHRDLTELESTVGSLRAEVEQLQAERRAREATEQEAIKLNMEIAGLRSKLEETQWELQHTPVVL